MPSTPREIETTEELQALLDRGETLRGRRLESLDLGPSEGRLLDSTDVRGLVVLGGEVSERLAGHLRAHGAIIFPNAPDTPVPVYRSTLYSPVELYAGLAGGYDLTADARAYAWSRDAELAHDVYVTLLRAIHDDQIADALDERLHGRVAVGVMGGHALARGEETYADAAALGHRLAAAGLVVLTGGGPGAMEAANLGALAASRDDLDGALDRLAGVPSFRPSVEDWAALALDVRAGLVGTRGDTGTTRGPAPVRSIGIPTWFYGHEPPNVFCDGIAKFFSNALREDGLLARSTQGIVVLPGAAGTAQEVFQAVTPLYYAAEGATLPRLVLVGASHWTTAVPLWPAVEALAAGRAMSGRVHLVDDVTEAAEILLG